MPFSKEELNTRFLKDYQQLNEHQRFAVDAIEGPVMVNAGPGTGKTQILALRIANILYKTDTNPDNILCLTYTDNGAVEMRNRLLRMIGAAAYRVRIHTFHSFCNEIIQDNLTYFGKLNLSPIGDLEEIDLYYKLIDSIEKGNILKRYRGDIYYEKDRLKNLFSLMKKEAWSPEYIHSRIDAYLKSLPTKEGFYYKREYKGNKPGSPKESAIRDETDKMEMLRAASDLYPGFNDLMVAEGRYNFDDMILWVLRAFGENKDMLLDYQEQFMYILVDEFQDTSRSQNLLLDYLAGYWDSPNLFVVGDADQSIFSFQDANVQNIHSFEKKYKERLTRIDLRYNYRSTSPILTTAHRLISRNVMRSISRQNDSPLVSANESPGDLHILPVISEYANPSQEAVDIVLQIENLLKEGNEGKEIAVIYRNHAQVGLIVNLFEVKNIPFNLKKKVDILQLPFVQNILLLLKWVNRENRISFSGDDLLFMLLHSDFFRLSPLEIALLSIKVNQLNRGAKGETYSLRRLIAETTSPAPDLFTPVRNQSFKQVSDMLEGLIKSSVNHTVQQLLELTIQKAGILSYVMDNEEKPWLMQVLNSLFDNLKESCHRNPDLTLDQWLTDLDRMKNNRLPVSLYKITANDNGINLVTAHGSKGSEFKYVFVIGCTQDIWDKDKQGAKFKYKLPDNLFSGNSSDIDGGAELDLDLEERRRLFYVAITRAKTHLFISYYRKDNKEKYQVRSAFIEEIMENNALTLTVRDVPDNLMIDLVSLQFREKARPKIELVESQFIDQLLKNYTLSVTHLNNYLQCPLKFYYQNLLKVPAAKNEVMAFGSAVHGALERLFLKMKANGDRFPSKAAFIEDFNWYMKNNREAFTPESFRLKTEYGEKILPDYYDYYIHRWNKIVLVEKNVRNITVQQVPINGKLDKLEFKGNNVNVVDYKTGKYENGKKKLSRPNEKEPNGGDYWRQAVFYKILLDNDPSNNWITGSTEFDFVEPVADEYKTEVVEITPADITTVTRQIVGAWEKIQNREFHTGCGKPDCEWCNFAKTYHLDIALLSADEDGADN